MAQLKGIDIVVRNLNKEIKKIEGRSLKGLIKSAALIRKDMEDTPPLIPVDTGNLRASWFTSPFMIGKLQGLLIGFTAAYAFFVHEIIGRNFKRLGAGAKFFEAALKRNTNKILSIIQQEAKIK